MSEIRVAVPEGMADAVEEAVGGIYRGARPLAEAVLRWQAENPPVPTEDQMRQIQKKLDGKGLSSKDYYAEWVRMMHLAPEPEVSEWRKTGPPLTRESMLATLLQEGVNAVVAGKVVLNLFPEPVVPEDIKDLLWDETLAPGSAFTFRDTNEAIIEAYKRGKAAR